MVLAQASALSGPEIVWTSFAPELLTSAAALLLLLLAVAGRRRAFVAVPAGLLAVGVGAWLVSAGSPEPGVIVAVFGALVAAVTVGFSARPQLVHVWIAGLAAVGALAMTAWLYFELMAPAAGTVVAPGSFVGGSVAVDGIALFTRITVYVTLLLVLPVGYGYLDARGIAKPEFEPLVLLSATGMALLGAANDLITIFVTYEILSIALYVLAGLARRDRRSQESSIKYFVLGAVTSAIMLYGMALLYTATGTLELSEIATGLALVTTPIRVAVVGLALVLVGLGFKIALVPFQLWTPDVYQGAPTNVTAFMAAATKAAGFAVVLRLFLVAFAPLTDVWVPILAVLAAMTMVYGAVVAVVQHDVKRILAYSSLAHAGYAAIGVVAANQEGLSGTLWYLLTYAVSTLGAFGCVVALEQRRRGEVTLTDLRGLGRSSPVLAGILTLCLLSLAGIPPTAGFAGKLAVFRAGVVANLEWLVVIGVVSSIIAAFFYLRLMGMMFLEEPEADAEEPVVSTGLAFGVSFAVAGVIVLGVVPSQFGLELAETVAVLAR